MIQGVISRMSGFSAAAKNFAVTVSVAIVAIAFDREAPSLLWTGIAATILFLLMDGYYHLLEVRFRELYRTTAERPIELGSDMLLNAPLPTGANVRKVLISATLLPFYVLLLFALVIALKEASDVPTSKIGPKPVAARDSASAPREAPTSPQRAGGPVFNSSEADDKRARGPAAQANAAEAKRVGDVR